MHLFYIDDSKDEACCVFSALCIPGDKWKIAFQEIKDFRGRLKASDGILRRVEFHATDLVAGRGHLGPNIVTKYRRCQIFVEALDVTASLPGASLINAIAPVSKESWAFERLLNRINKAMERGGSQAVVISDKGKEHEYTKLARKMGVYNPIPSRFGSWGMSATKNLPIERVIEDIFFKDSKSSYFIQLADLCAYALLRRERPLASKTKYGLDKAFGHLGPILNRNANGSDPEGIIRV